MEKALERENMSILSVTPAVSLIIDSWEIEGEQTRAYCVADVKSKEDVN